MAARSTGMRLNRSRRMKSRSPFHSRPKRSSSRRSSALSAIRANVCTRRSATICTSRRFIPERSQGIGPRYCPSIEDKVVKFADKDRHQLFLEPEGHNTNEVYLNGFSTSLPSELQLELLRMIDGFESRPDHPARICDRIRFCRSARDAADDGIDADGRAFSGRPDKRHDRI